MDTLPLELNQSTMRPQYPLEYRQQIVQLVRAGRSLEPVMTRDGLTEATARPRGVRLHSGRMRTVRTPGRGPSRSRALEEKSRAPEGHGDSILYRGAGI